MLVKEKYPGMKHFRAIHWLKIRWVIENVLNLETFSVCFRHGISWRKNSLWQAKCFILWYSSYFTITSRFLLSSSDFSYGSKARMAFTNTHPLFKHSPTSQPVFQRIQVFRNYAALDGYRVRRINCKILEDVHNLS